jgi:hypothetical protein
MPSPAAILRNLFTQMSSDSDYDIDGDREEEDGPREYELILCVDGCDSDDYDYSDYFIDSDDPGDFIDLDDSDEEAILTI